MPSFAELRFARQKEGSSAQLRNREVQLAEYAKLREWGFDNVRFLDLEPTSNHFGEFRLDDYAQHLRGELNPQTATLGELRIPDRLNRLISSVKGREILEKIIIGLTHLPNGMGHRRPARFFEILCHVLGINVTDIDFDAGKTRFEQMVAVLKSFYEMASQLEATGDNTDRLSITRKKPDVRFLGAVALSAVFSLIQKFSQEQFQNLIMGKAGEKADPGQIRLAHYFLEPILSPGFRKALGEKGVTHCLNFHPILISLASKFMQVLGIATDSVVNAAGWSLDRDLMVETDTARARELYYWGKTEENQSKIHVSHDFPAPVEALMRNSAIQEERRENINTQPPVLFLAASGVATVQFKSFKETIIGLIPQLSTGNLRIVIQAGTGHTGQKMHENLMDLINHFPDIKDNVVILFGETPTAAVDTFDVVSTTVNPLIIASKASEMSRVAAALDVPFIDFDTIGEHEKWNGVISLRQGSPISFLPTARRKIRNFMRRLVDEDVLEQQLEETSFNSISEAVDHACEEIKNGQKKQTEIPEHRAMLQALEILLCS